MAGTRKSDQGGKKSLLKRLLSPTFGLIVAVVLLIGLSIFTYLYIQAANELERWLSGEQSTQEPTIIYAAPRLIRVGQKLSRDRVLEHLSRAGYTDVSKTEDLTRGRYKISRQEIEVMPGAAASMGGQRIFPHVKITFAADDRSIQRLLDVEENKELSSCQLEPEQISSLARQLGEPEDHKRGLRLEVEYKQIPQHLINAVVAVEDQRFFEHTGVDYLGIMRALWRDIQPGGVIQGASTITQQLVQNIIVGKERSTFRSAMKRKIREAFLALALERRLTKEQIFTKYANVIYLGRRGGFSIYGFGAAARQYFNKDISQLTLSEAAFLAGIINRPGYYIANTARQEVLERGVKRRNIVLDLMTEEKFITEQEAAKAKQGPLNLQFRQLQSGTEVSAPYFLDYVQADLSELVPASDLGQLGYRIYTTIDMELQRAATTAVAQGLEQLDQELAKRRKQKIPPGTIQGALVAIDARTGEILAMVGGRNYLDSQFNRAADAKRQPGSAVKPFVYAAALASGEHEGKPITLAALYMDEPKEFEGGYAPKNFGGSYLNRPVTAREALARSLNVITVSLAQDTGYSVVAETIGKCGIPRPPAQGASALGASEATPLQMASAYSVFANNGQRVVPLAINRIADADGRQVHQSKPQRIEAISPQVAYLVLSAMQSVITEPYGTGRAAAQLGLEQVAGKTGTSQRSDAWFAGITPRIICVTWVGFDDNRSLEMTGGHAALPMWIAFMRQVASSRPDLVGGSFERPEGIVERVIDPMTGQRATDQCPERKVELFIEGREVEEICATHPGKPIEELPPTIIPIESTPAQPNSEPTPTGAVAKPATDKNDKKDQKTRPKFVRQRPGRNGPQ